MCPTFWIWVCLKIGASQTVWCLLGFPLNKSQNSTSNYGLAQLTQKHVPQKQAKPTQPVFKGFCLVDLTRKHCFVPFEVNLSPKYPWQNDVVQVKVDDDIGAVSHSSGSASVFSFYSHAA